MKPFTKKTYPNIPDNKLYTLKFSFVKFEIDRKAAMKRGIILKQNITNISIKKIFLLILEIQYIVKYMIKSIISNKRYNNE